jgi:hypothetical protein
VPTGEMGQFRRPEEVMPPSPHQRLLSSLARGATVVVGPDGMRELPPDGPRNP